MRLKRIFVAGLLLLGGTFEVANALDVSVTPVPVPEAMGVIGDSIAAGYAVGSSNSWASGEDINSHLTRLKRLFPIVEAHNVATPGAYMIAFASQANTLVSTHPNVGYVTVSLGAADVCLPLGGSAPVPSEFRAQFRSGLTTLKNGLPNVKILATSIPNLRSMQNAMLRAGRPGTSNFCTRFFDNPGSSAPSDVARRDLVMREVKTLNAIIRQECLKVSGCKFDNGAVFKHRWVSAEIHEDGIHPTVAGQKMMAQITWRSGYRWSTPN